MPKQYLILLLIPFMISSCEKDEGAIPLIFDYLPMEVGNYWQLEFSERMEIIGTKTINERNYFIVVHNNDTAYYRNDNDRIFVIESIHDEALKFDLTANESESWSYGLWTVTLISKSDTIEIKDKKIANCYHFYFDIPIMVDEEHSIWLAPEIGFFQEQCGECLHQIRKLDIAQIGGQIYDY